MLTAAALAQHSPITVRPIEEWSTWFGNQRISLGYHIDGRLPANTRIVWSSSAKHRTLMRGEQELQDGRAGNRSVRVDLAIPPVRDGVTVELQFLLQVVEPNGRIAADHERTLRIFARDPFATRRQWIEDHAISLYDPGGDTAKVLDAMQVPYDSPRHLSNLLKTTGGVVVVGAGFSWQTPANPATVVTDLARQGRRVICLAPEAGQLAFPATEEAVDRPASLTFRRADVIGELDKRLDVCAWPPDGQVVRSAMTVVSRRGQVVLSVDDSPAAWPWIEIAYNNGGRLTICGLAIIEKWDSGPTPRYLLAKMLE
jgi:hypothetical protein